MGFWGYDRYYRPSRPKKVDHGLRTKSKRGRIGETWWSKRWIEVLESFNMGARLTRGRAYARQGQVIYVEIDPGLVRSEVQGSRRKPYGVEIRLNPLSKKDWNKVTDEMAAQAIFAAKLLAGEMPQNIEDAFAKARVSLFPTRGDDLRTQCSCPDWANPCKHIAAVYFLLAERFDEDPFLIFKLRGRTKEDIVETLREKRAARLSIGSLSSAEDTNLQSQDEIMPLESCLASFWKAGDGLDSFIIRLAAPEVDKAVLKRLGDAPFTVKGKNFTSLLSGVYDAVKAASLQKITREEAGR